MKYRVPGTFKENDLVLLVYDKKRRWMKKITDKAFHTNYGHVNLMELVGQPLGSSLQTNKGKWIKATLPTLLDWFDFFEHKSQIIYAKDAAMISLLLDAKPGDKIYEAGTGSGALTSLLSRAVGDRGSIITHENREDAQKVAIKNVEKLGLTNIEFISCDVIEDGFAPGEADSLILDMGDPWLAIPRVVEIMKIGGRIVLFIPTFQQLEKAHDALDENEFKGIRTIELIEREIQMKKHAYRPSTRMIGHTGFLMSATYHPLGKEKEMVD